MPLTIKPNLAFTIQTPKLDQRAVTLDDKTSAVFNYIQHTAVEEYREIDAKIAKRDKTLASDTFGSFRDKARLTGLSTNAELYKVRDEIQSRIQNLNEEQKRDLKQALGNSQLILSQPRIQGEPYNRPRRNTRVTITATPNISTRLQNDLFEALGSSTRIQVNQEKAPEQKQRFVSSAIEG